MDRRTSLTLGVLTLALAGVFLTLAMSERQPIPVQAGQGAASDVSAPSPSGMPDPTITMSPSKEASVSPAAVRRVPASPMLRLDIPALKRSFAVEGVSLGSPITPPFDAATVASTLYYENNHTVRGADPGTDAANTVYVTGHTWRGGDAAMNAIDAGLATGDELFVTTTESRHLGVRLRYVVADQATYQEALLPSVDKVWQVAPGRMVIMTCNLREDGAHQTHTRVFYAELSGVVR